LLREDILVIAPLPAGRVLLSIHDTLYCVEEVACSSSTGVLEEEEVFNNSFIHSPSRAKQRQLRDRASKFLFGINPPESLPIASLPATLHSVIEIWHVDACRTVTPDAPRWIAPTTISLGVVHVLSMKV
jgi:hypothetical protein